MEIKFTNHLFSSSLTFSHLLSLSETPFVFRHYRLPLVETIKDKCPQNKIAEKSLLNCVCIYLSIWSVLLCNGIDVLIRPFLPPYVLVCVCVYIYVFVRLFVHLLVCIRESKCRCIYTNADIALKHLKWFHLYNWSGSKNVSNCRQYRSRTYI